MDADGRNLDPKIQYEMLMCTKLFILERTHLVKVISLKYAGSLH